MSNSKLGAYIQRIMRLEEEKRGLAADIAEVYKEAQEDGLDPKIMREVVKRQKMTEHELRERQRLIEEYESAIADLSGTPLGDAGRVHVRVL